MLILDIFCYSSAFSMEYDLNCLFESDNFEETLKTFVVFVRFRQINVGRNAIKSLIVSIHAYI